MISLVPVRIAYAALGSGSAPVWTAKEAGIFASEGLETDVSLVRGSGRVTKALLANEVQFANIAAPLVVAADLKGGDLVYLTGGINRLIQCIITRADIHSHAELRGRVFGANNSGGGVDGFLLDYLLGPYGLNHDTDLKKRAIENQPDAIAKLDSGEIDAALFSPPYSFEAVKHGHRMLIDGADYGIDYQLGGIVARRGYVQENPEVTRKIVRAYVRGIHRYKTDRALALSVFRKYSLIEDEDVARQCYHAANRFFQQKPYPTAAGLQRVLDQISRRDAAPQRLRAQDLMDCRWLSELDHSGFIDNLYGTTSEEQGS